MKKTAVLFIIFFVCTLTTKCTRAENNDDPNGEEESLVKIILTKLDVNDTNLELGWKITNDTDHDIWICNNFRDFERFLDKDSETLVLRRRFNLKVEDWMLWEFPFLRGYYVRLSPGQERVESVWLEVPVTPRRYFVRPRGNAEYAQRISLEIGFYNEDLPTLILNIVEMAEKLNCDISLTSPASPPLDPNDNRMELNRRFFEGVFIARFFNLESFTYFRDSVLSGTDEITTPYLWQTLNGEQVLRIEIDNLLIPYKSSYPPLTNHIEKGAEYLQSEKTNSSDSEKPVSEKGLRKVSVTESRDGS